MVIPNVSPDCNTVDLEHKTLQRYFFRHVVVNQTESILHGELI